MNRWLTIIGLGVVTWAVPFILSIPLLPLMQSDPAFFKTIMIVTGSFTGMIATVYFLKNSKKDPLREGIVLGINWLLINWILDLVILLPFTKQAVPRYFMEIGLEYLAIPIMTIGVGYALKAHNRKK